jgi:hypothetical protein
VEVEHVMNSKQNNVFEALETRTLMSGTVALTIHEVPVDGGVELQITGSAKNDNITVTKTSAGLVIKNNNNWSRTRSGHYCDIKIDGAAGDDKITVDAKVFTSNVIYGGDGNDTISAGSGNDSIYAGAGNDLVYGNRGEDTIVTVGGGNYDLVYGGKGMDSVWRDSAGKERFLDMCAEEVAGGADHRIASFTNGSQRVSKELVGQRLSDPTTAGYAYHTFSDRPLFSTSGPNADDVKQGQTGDCYFLATLASVADTDTNVIKQSVVDLGDGTYAVQFAKYDGSKTFIRVDNDLATFSWNANQPAYASFGANGSMWVAVVEKAFTYFRNGAGTYDSISAGWMSEALTALGKPTSSTWTESNANELMGKIEEELNAGKSVTAACFTNPAGCNMVTSHAYTVDHVVTNNDGSKSVVVRNPWGIDGYSCNDGHNDGYVTLTAAQAFQALTYLTSANV